MTRPEDEPVVGSRDLGNRVHLALEAHYGYGIDPLHALSVIYTDLIEANESHAHELGLERAYAMTMVKGYLDWAAESGMDAEYEVIGTEADVSVPFTVGELEIRLRGRLDQVVRRRGGDEAVLFRDFKTVGTLLKSTELIRDEQMRFYALIQWMLVAKNGLSLDQRVDGGLYTMLLRSKRTTRAKGPFYDAIQVRYNRHDHESMTLRIRSVVNEIMSAMWLLDHGADHREVAYPTPSDFCKWGCAFEKVCHLADDGSRFDDALTANFQQVDPYAYYSSGKIDSLRKRVGEMKSDGESDQ